jgi:hypothetical protein
MMGLLQRTLVAAAILSALLAGCSAGQIGDTLPSSMGGLPQGAPARPNGTGQKYPAVHDMPVARPTQPLSEEDQVKLEKDLQAVRDRQSATTAADAAPAPVAAAKPAPKPVPKAAAKKQTDAKAPGAGAPGAKTSGASTNP